MTDLLIQNCDIIQYTDNLYRVVQNQDITIVGNKIDGITDTGTIPITGTPVIIKGQGFLAAPGLINTHAHVPMVLFRGLAEDVTIDRWFNEYIWPLETNEIPEDIYWGGLLGIAEMIENGITYVADHYFFMDKMAEAVRDSGIRANLCWAVFGHEGQTKLDQTSDFITRWQGAAENRITTWLGPHAPYTTGPDFLKVCSERAKELGVGMHIHVSETQEQVNLSLKEYGITPIKMLEEAGFFDTPSILGHCLAPAEEDFAILSKYQTGIAHAPKTYMKLGMGTTPVQKYRSHNIPVGIATDGVVSSNTLDILEQTRLMALTQKLAYSDPTIMTVNETLDTLFHGSARVIQLEEKLGDILPGKLADIILIRQDGLHTFPRFDPLANLVYSSRSSDIDTVICNGKVLMKNRKLLTIDKDLVKREVSARLERLNQRIPGKRLAFYPA